MSVLCMSVWVFNLTMFLFPWLALCSLTSRNLLSGCTMVVLCWFLTPSNSFSISQLSSPQYSFYYRWLTVWAVFSTSSAVFFNLGYLTVPRQLTLVWVCLTTTSYIFSSNPWRNYIPWMKVESTPSSTSFFNILWKLVMYLLRSTPSL